LFSDPDLGLMHGEEGDVVAFRNEHLRRLAVDPALGHAPLGDRGEVSGMTASGAKGMRRLLSGHVAAMTPPIHRPARKVFARPFAQGGATAYSDYANRAVDLTLAWAAENSPVDCQDDIAVGVTRRFWALLIGLSEQEATAAAQLTADVLPLLVSRYGSDSGTDENDPAWEYMEVIAPAIQRRLESGESQLLADMAAGLEKIDVPGRPDNVGELLGATLFDGFDTLSRNLANVIYCLTTSDSQPLEAVRRDPSLIADAYFESNRLHPPLFSTARFTHQTVSLDSIEIPPGTAVTLLWLFGNRDPEVFVDPETFKFGRPRQGQVTFGGGSYVCPGRGVAKVVGEALIRGIAGDTFSLSVAGKAKWTPFSMAHTLESMPIEVERRRSAAPMR
jgi:cytochrome P450